MSRPGTDHGAGRDSKVALETPPQRSRGIVSAWLPATAFLIGATVGILSGRTAAAYQVIIREVRQVQVKGVQQDPAAADEAVEEVEVAAPAQVMMINDAQFDMWVFGGPRNSGAGRNKLDALLDLSVDEVSRECSLSDIQRQKLLLAGRGDIKRFFEKVEEKRKKFDKLKTDQNKIGELYQELVPLQAALHAGLFGDGSLYSKTLKRVLGEHEDARYEEVVREKNRFRYRAKVGLAVAQLDQTLGLSDKQRRDLVELILQECQPPSRYGQYDYYLILYQAGKIHRDKLKPLFKDKQWAFFVRQLDQMRGMEQFLRNQGLLPARDEAAEIAGEFVKALREPPRRQAELPEDVFGGDRATGPATAADRPRTQDLVKGVKR
jgi:hypothetical protein